MTANNYIHKTIQNLKTLYSHENEFLQAVEEVLYSIEPVLVKHPEYIDTNILGRLVEPERGITFRVPWEDRHGAIQVNRGYRYQFNSAIGPFKGGLRFHKSVHSGIIKFLGFEQIFKNALTTLPLGGGKGGSDFDPKDKTDVEIMRFCQSFMMELYRHIGPNIDVPAGDIGVGGREIGYLYGMYKRIKNATDQGVLTGKDVEWGGSYIRPEATGFGATYFAQNMLNHDGVEFKDKVVLVSGYGNVAWGTCIKVRDLGGKVVTISGSTGFVHDPEGITTEEKFNFLLEMRVLGKTLKDYAEKFNATFYPDQKPWIIPADIAIPCATQNEIYLEDAEILSKNGCKYIVEASNMPVHSEVYPHLQKLKITLGPGKAANAGGVAVSGLEMSQNSLRLQWTRAEVDSRLEQIMKSIYNSCVTSCEEYGLPYNLVQGANIASFQKVARAMMAQGLY